MNEYLASAIIYIIFLIASLLFLKMMIKLKSEWLVLLCVLGYFISFYYYFELINNIHHSLRDRGIYIEF
jgi:hypothetical protein